MDSIEPRHEVAPVVICTWRSKLREAHPVVTPIASEEPEFAEP